MEKEKNNVGLYVIIVVLCVIVAILLGVIIYNNQSAKKLNEQNTIKNNEKVQNNNNFVSKIDDSKDWIYDAEYPKNVKADSYQISDKTYYAKDIIVPFININSSYAKSSNEEIKNVLRWAVDTYNSGVSNKIDYVEECNYKTYTHDDVISVFLTYSVNNIALSNSYYKAYNIDLKTGNKKTYQEIYSKAGINSSEIDNKVKNAISNTLRNKMIELSLDLDSEDYPFDNLNKDSYNHYKDSVTNDTLYYFLDDNKKLNIITTLYVPAGQGGIDTVITID